jgi:hypothetical protein
VLGERFLEQFIRCRHLLLIREFVP